MTGAGDEQAFSRDVRDEARRQGTMLLRSGVARDEAEQELVDNAVPRELAAGTIAALVDERRRRWASTAKGLVIIGALLLAASAAVAALSYGASEGEYVTMLTGAVAAGLSALAVGVGMLLRPRKV